MYEFEPEFEELMNKKSSRGPGSKPYPSTHLQSALNDDLIRYMYDQKVDNPGRFRHVDPEISDVLDLYPELVDQSFDDSVDFTGVIFQWFLNLDEVKCSSNDEDMWLTQEQVMSFNINSQLSALKKFHSSININSVCFPWRKNSLVHNLKVSRELFDIAVTASARMRMKFTGKDWRGVESKSPGPKSFKMPGDLRVSYTANLAVFKSEKGTCVGPRDLLLLFGDLLSERYLILSACVIAEELQEMQYPRTSLVSEIFNWGDKLLRDKRLKGYVLLKEFEPLLTSEVLVKYEDRFGDGDNFRSSIIRDLVSEDGEFGSHITSLLTTLSGVTSIHHLSQIFGLYRLWGHPYVDTKAGLLKMKHLGMKRKIIPNDLIRELTCAFKEHLCVHYRGRYGRWPELDVDGLDEDSLLRKTIESNQLLKRSALTYKKSDWNKVKGKKTFEVDSSYNLANMLADKALSLNRRDLKFQCDVKKNIGLPRQRRVITSWLRSDQISAKKLIADVSEHGLPKEDLIIGVTPKEREMKKVPRMFSLMSLNMRMFIVAIGELLGDRIIPLFPEITVGDSATQLIRKMYDITKITSHKGKTDYAHVIVNIDFRKWNTNMRNELTQEPFKFLDELFGLEKGVSYIAPMFTSSLIYLADGSHLVRMDEDLDPIPGDPLVWEGHLGGLEGLNQKGWTAITVSLIEMVTAKMNIKFKLIGQGDNQVLRLSLPLVPKEEDPFGNIGAKQKLSDFKQEFSKCMDRAGLPVKMTETWCSSRLFSYGKQHFFDGEPLAMSLKRISRAFWLSNDLFPSLDNALSTIQSNLISACQSDLTIVVPFTISVMESAYAVMFHAEHDPYTGIGLDEWLRRKKGVWSVVVKDETTDLSTTMIKSCHDVRQANFSSYLRSNCMKRNWKVVSALLMFPTALGGYPSQFVSSYLMRGFPDGLTESYSMLKMIIEDCQLPDMKRSLMSICYPIFSPTCSSMMLVQDPYSLNILSPSSATGVLKTAVKSFLRSPGIVKNPFFQTFFDEADLYADPLCRALTKTTPVWPRLLHDLYDASLPGYSASVVGRIVKTSTIVMEAMKMDEKKVEEKMSSSDINQFISMIYKINLSDDHPMWDCSEEKAQLDRNVSWFSFAPIEGVTTPHPLEYLHSVELKYGDCEECNQSVTPDYILAYIQRSNDSNWLNAMWNKLGPSDPYLGSKTVEKVKQENTTSFELTDPLITRAARALRAINWIVREEDSFAELMTKIFRSITDVEPNHFFAVEDSFSGSAEHRYSDYSTYHGGLITTLYSLASYVHLSTNQWIRYGKGTTNHNIHFQAVLCVIQTSLLFSKRTIENYHQGSFHFHVREQSCIKELKEPHITGKEGVNAIDLPSHPDNEYCFIKQANLIERKCDYLKTKRFTPLEDVKPLEKELILCSTMAQELVDLILQKVKSLRLAGMSSSGVFHTTWGKDRSPEILLETVALYLAASVYRRNRHEIDISGNSTIYDLLQSVIGVIGALPSSCFSPLGFLFMFPESRLSLLLGYYAVDGPHTFPLKDSELAECSKQAIICVLNTTMVVERPSVMCTNKLILRQRDWISNQMFCSIARSQRLSVMWDSWIEIDRLMTNNEEYGPTDSLEDLISVVLFSCLPDKTNLSEEDRRSISGNWDVLWKSTVVTEHHVTGDMANKLREEVRSSDAPVSPKLTVIQSFEGLNSLKMEELSPPEWTTTRELDLEQGGAEPRAADFRSHFYRVLPLVTTAHYKYLEILYPIVSELSPGELVMVCGDGTGGVSTLVNRINPSCKVYFNSLVDLDTIVFHSLTTFYPPATDYFTDKSKLFKIRESIEGVSDLMNPSVSDQLISVAKGETCRLIVCDAEGGGWNNPRKGLTIMHNLLRGAMKMSGTPNLIMKTYFSNRKMLAIQAAMAFQLYKRVSLCRSSFSSFHNTEIFLLCCNQRRLDNVSLYELNIKTDTSVEGLVPVPQFFEFLDQACDKCRDCNPVTLEMSDRATDLLNSVTISSHASNRLNQSMRFMTIPRMLQHHELDFFNCYWKPIIKKLKSRLSAIKVHETELSVIASRNTSRDIMLHLFVLLSRVYDSEDLVMRVIPSIVGDCSVLFFATESRQTGAMIIPSAITDAINKEAELVRSSKGSHHGYQAYLVHCSSVYSTAQLKRVYMMIGQVRKFYGVKSSMRASNIYWIQDHRTTGLSDVKVDIGLKQSLMIKIPSFARPLASKLSGLLGPQFCFYKG